MLDLQYEKKVKHRTETRQQLLKELEEALQAEFVLRPDKAQDLTFRVLHWLLEKA